MEPNANWSGAIQPTLDSITFLFIDDLAVAANAYRTGEVQATVANLVELSVLESEFPDELISVNVPRTTALQFQLDPELSGNEVLAIPEVRLALARATDRETLNEVIFQGAHQPTTSWIPETDSGRPPDQYEDLIGFDPDAARELLAEAGFPDGEGFPGVTLILVDDASNRALGEFLQQQWREILNIDLELEIVDSQTRQDRFTNETFELSIGGWQHDYPDPENWILGLLGSEDSNNNTNCADEQIDALIAEAVFNDNNEERLDQYRQIEDRMIEIACGYSPIYHNNRYYLINSDLVGFVEFLNGGQDGSLPGDWFAEAWGIRA
jgi:oligopeptide transport system substrate-binding protein